MAIPGTSLSAQGTQTVTTIPAGKFGEYAGHHGHLHSLVFARLADCHPVSSRTDPRSGATTYQLSNITTAEPAESLFQLPSGLTLSQGPSAKGRRAQ